MQIIRSVITAILKKNVFLRKIVRKQVQKYKSGQYLRMAQKKGINPKLVLFESYMGRQYACSPKALYECMLQKPEFKDFKFIWFFQDTNKKELLPDQKRTSVIKYGSQQYYEAYAEAGYVITNSNIKNEIRKKEGQIFVQTWHGTPLKRLRCDIKAEHGNAYNTLEEIREKNDIDVIRYDGFISPSAFASERFISAFNLEKLGLKEIIIEEGYPRNDFLYNYTEEDVIRIKQKLGIGENSKKIIFYAPTFRDNQHDARKGYTYDIHLDFDVLREAVGDQYIILFRPHYFIADSFDFAKYRGFVYDVSDVDDINELYIISDILITDYSSVFFDFANLRRPILFYMYDLKEYGEDIRGFYLSLDCLPGEIVTSEEELRKCLEKSEFDYNESYKKFNETFNYLDDGNVSDRVVSQIFKI